MNEQPATWWYENDTDKPFQVDPDDVNDMIRTCCYGPFSSADEARAKQVQKFSDHPICDDCGKPCAPGDDYCSACWDSYWDSYNGPQPNHDTAPAQPLAKLEALRTENAALQARIAELEAERDELLTALKASDKVLAPFANAGIGWQTHHTLYIWNEYDEYDSVSGKGVILTTEHLEAAARLAGFI